MWCTEVGPARLLGHHNVQPSDSVTTDVMPTDDNHPPANSRLSIERCARWAVAASWNLVATIIGAVVGAIVGVMVLVVPLQALHTKNGLITLIVFGLAIYAGCFTALSIRRAIIRGSGASTDS